MTANQRLVFTKPGSSNFQSRPIWQLCLHHTAVLHSMTEPTGLALANIRTARQLQRQEVKTIAHFAFRISNLLIHLFNLHKMFRTALLRSARCLAQAAPRAQVSVASRVVPNSFLMSRTAGPSTMIPTIRAYSAHAGLSQDEVQGRILDLLKNFDKVGHAQLRRERL